MPESIVRSVASRYVAGVSLNDAIVTARRLNSANLHATFDILGEEVASETDARATTDAYLKAVERITLESLDANVSVKLTGIGLRLSYELCREQLFAIARSGMFVRIDMEDSSTVGDTLKLYRDLRESGLNNVGVVLQAYLRRTLDDVESLADLKPNVRLCKGIYNEPSQLRVGGRDDVRTNYLRTLEQLLAFDVEHIAFATHDEFLIREVLTRSVPNCEFQMLLGVRQERARELADSGHRVRIYVPYGRDWYDYSMRRLRESPALARTVARGSLVPLLRVPRRRVMGRNQRKVSFAHRPSSVRVPRARGASPTPGPPDLPYGMNH